MVASRKYAAPKVDGSAAMTTARCDGSINPAHDREIDLRHMDEQNLKSLQKSDPFMYYSIPGVLNATRRNQEVDYSDITNLSRGDSHSSSSRPSRLHEEQGEREDDASKVVSRRARVSFECPSSVVMEDIMEDFEQEEFGDLSFDLDDFVSMLSNMSTSTRQ